MLLSTRSETVSREEAPPVGMYEADAVFGPNSRSDLVPIPLRQEVRSSVHRESQDDED
jgi:hypothetical protein